jgi:hypothetical protein
MRVGTTFAMTWLATVALLAAADAPYFGKWILNSAKSDLGSMTLSLESMKDGGFKQIVTLGQTKCTFVFDRQE